MKTLERLKGEAREAANFRGHTLNRFKQVTRTAATAKCKNCDEAVTVNARPLPNDIDVGGTAVAINCGGFYE